MITTPSGNLSLFRVPRICLRSNKTGAQSGVNEDVSGGVNDNSSWLDNLNVQQHWIVKIMVSHSSRRHRAIKKDDVNVSIDLKW